MLNMINILYNDLKNDRLQQLTFIFKFLMDWSISDGVVNLLRLFFISYLNLLIKCININNAEMKVIAHIISYMLSIIRCRVKKKLVRWELIWKNILLIIMSFIPVFYRSSSLSRLSFQIKERNLVFPIFDILALCMV